jgi:Protein of unknown function (DUF2892)
MTVEAGMRLLAGTLVLLSLGLACLPSPYWLLFTAFIGLTLLQSGLTNWCPAMTIARKLVLKDGSARDR